MGPSDPAFLQMLMACLHWAMRPRTLPFPSGLHSPSPLSLIAGAQQHCRGTLTAAMEEGGQPTRSLLCGLLGPYSQLETQGLKLS